MQDWSQLEALARLATDPSTTDGERAAAARALAGRLADPRTGLEAQRGELEAQRSELEAQRGELERQRGELEAQRGELERQRGELFDLAVLGAVARAAGVANRPVTVLSAPEARASAPTMRERWRR